MRLDELADCGAGVEFFGSHWGRRREKSCWRESLVKGRGRLTEDIGSVVGGSLLTFGKDA